jgi:hypothetical protein
MYGFLSGADTLIDLSAYFFIESEIYPLSPRIVKFLSYVA